MRALVFITMAMHRVENVHTLKNPSLAYLNLLLTGLGPHYVAGGEKTFHPKKNLSQTSCETNHDFYKMEKK